MDKLEYLMSLSTTVAFCDEAIDIFVAHNLIPSHQNLDEDEVINVEPCELSDLEEMIYTGTVSYTHLEVPGNRNHCHVNPNHGGQFLWHECQFQGNALCKPSLRVCHSPWVCPGPVTVGSLYI